MYLLSLVKFRFPTATRFSSAPATTGKPLRALGSRFAGGGHPRAVPLQKCSFCCSEPPGATNSRDLQRPAGE